MVVNLSDYEYRQSDLARDVLKFDSTKKGTAQNILIPKCSRLQVNLVPP